MQGWPWASFYIKWPIKTFFEESLMSVTFGSLTGKGWGSLNSIFNVQMVTQSPDFVRVTNPSIVSGILQQRYSVLLSCENKNWNLCWNGRSIAQRYGLREEMWVLKYLSLESSLQLLLLQSTQICQFLWLLRILYKLC